MSTQHPGAGAGPIEQQPAVVSLVKLGTDGFVLAKLDQSVPPGEYNVTLDVVITPVIGGAGLCGARGSCCKKLVVND